MFLKYLKILVLAILVVSCNNNSITKTIAPRKIDHIGATKSMANTTAVDSIWFDEIIFGRFCGECIGNCAPMFQLKTLGNTATLKASYDNTYFEDEDKLAFTTDLNTAKKLAIAFEIMHNLPEILLKHSENEVTYGCPDCTDGCGIYVKLKQTGGITRKFHLDTDASAEVPKVITTYAQMVSTKVNVLLQ